jgi:hypothetical protein
MKQLKRAGYVRLIGLKKIRKNFGGKMFMERTYFRS